LGFNAATVIEALDFTFEPYVKGCKGTIAEPNDAMLQQYVTDLKAIGLEVKESAPNVSSDADVSDLLDALDQLDPESVTRLTERMAGINAALCGGFPSKEQILALPPRQRAMFYAWLQQEVMSPEAAPGGGSAQAKTLRPVAVG